MLESPILEPSIVEPARVEAEELELMWPALEEIMSEETGAPDVAIVVKDSIDDMLYWSRLQFPKAT